MSNRVADFVAIRITRENYDSLSAFNRGGEIELDAVGDVFVFPLTADEVPDIIDIIDFFEEYEVADVEKLNKIFAVNCFRKKE